MVNQTKLNLLLGISALGLFSAQSAFSAEIDTNIAQMQAMDKITGQVSIIEVPVNSHKRFGSFDILVRSCKTRSPEDTPENFAFVDVIDDYNQKPVNIFRGWMISSSPALNAIEHPIYDVWLLKCINGNVDPKSLLSKEELAARDKVEKASKTPVDNKLKKSVVEEPKKEDVKPEAKPQASDAIKEDALPQQENANKNLLEKDIQDKKLETSPVDNIKEVPSEPSLPIDENASLQEDGAPKSLLNFSNNRIEEEKEDTSEVKEIIQEDDVLQENNAPQNLIQEKEIAPIEPQVQEETSDNNIDIEAIDEELSSLDNN